MNSEKCSRQPEIEAPALLNQLAPVPTSGVDLNFFVRNGARELENMIIYSYFFKPKMMHLFKVGQSARVCLFQVNTLYTSDCVSRWARFVAHILRFFSLVRSPVENDSVCRFTEL